MASEQPQTKTAYCKILGFRVRVVFSDGMPGGLVGHCCGTDGVIWIDTKIPEDRQYATFLHEAMHFVLQNSTESNEELTQEGICIRAENLATIEWEE